MTIGLLLRQRLNSQGLLIKCTGKLDCYWKYITLIIRSCLQTDGSFARGVLARKIYPYLYWRRSPGKTCPLSYNLLSDIGCKTVIENIVYKISAEVKISVEKSHSRQAFKIAHGPTSLSSSAIFIDQYRGLHVLHYTVC